MRKERIVIRYSQAFKQQVIQEIEEGRWSIKEAMSVYGIKGSHTISGWLRRMGKLELLPKHVRVEKPDEKDQIKELQRKIKELKDALAETQVRCIVAEVRFDIVCKDQGLDPEEVKKKLQEKPSSNP
jgi:transposase